MKKVLTDMHAPFSIVPGLVHRSFLFFYGLLWCNVLLLMFVFSFFRASSFFLLWILFLGFFLFAFSYRTIPLLPNIAQRRINFVSSSNDPAWCAAAIGIDTLDSNAKIPNDT